LGARQLIGLHPGQRLRFQEANSVHFTVAEKDASEFQIIVHRGPETLATGFIRHVVRAFGYEHARLGELFGQFALFIETVSRRAPIVLLAWDEKSCVLHSERTKNSPLQHNA